MVELMQVKQNIVQETLKLFTFSPLAVLRSMRASEAVESGVGSNDDEICTAIVVRRSCS